MLAHLIARMIRTAAASRRKGPTDDRAVVEAIGEYTELFYNSHRRHSSLGFKSPNQFETAFERASRMAA